ncbi:carbohydrate ABC transporter permease [Brooklawnia cerclae]|uniref:N,N'-diacetylchitobiose transport system permease protein n=1 Tax=Brooklawnia cerclae TaxID=349934 RepID=A0ABX0SIX8_9ACTN|nr:sugar ABC transporter permease [Brooklawnia cerclae]NIH58347.1 N,N'-diacetylchitobiose transport system permease protein [Brooklawnia cerclae]
MASPHTEQGTPATPGAPAGVPASRGRRFSSRRAALRRRPWLLLAPMLIVLAILLVWPLGRVIWLSFQNYGLRELNRGTTNFVGFDNYAAIFGDEYLYSVVLPNTIGLAVACVVLTVGLGTLVALFLKGLPTFWRYVVSTALMIAWAVPAVTGTYVWVFVFDPSNGLATNLLGSLGVIEPGTVNWFLERWSFYSIVTLNVVQHSIPFVAVTVLAGLLTVPDDLYEAAKIDGAGAWQRFWNVTAPNLRPVFAVVTILSTIWDFKVFTQMWLMPGGGGTNPQVFNLSVWAYVQSFAQSEYGMGSAIAVVLTLVLMAITLVYLRTLFKEDEL